MVYVYDERGSPACNGAGIDISEISSLDYYLGNETGIARVTEADFSEAIFFTGTIKYKISGYSEKEGYYTPQYDPPMSPIKYMND